MEPVFVGQTLSHSVLIGDLPKPVCSQSNTRKYFQQASNTSVIKKVHLVFKTRESTKNSSQVFGVEPQTLEHVVDNGK